MYRTNGGMNLKKFLLSIGIAMLTLSLSTTPSSAEWNKYFEDVPLTNSHYSNIYYLAEIDVIKGDSIRYKDYEGDYYYVDYFKPSNKVTKRHVATMLVRALKLEKSSYSNPGFKDVPTNDRTYKEIAIASEKGFFKKGTYFKPNDYITREEMAYTLTKAFNLTGSSTMKFSDVPSSHAASPYVQALAANNITTGSNGRFNPSNHLTRAQFASFLTRAMLPASRPNNAVITSNMGIVPNTYDKTYTYEGSYEGDTYRTVFDSVYDHSRYDYKTTIMDHVSDQGSVRIDYSENQERFDLLAMMDYVTVRLNLKYPIKTGTTNTIKGSTYYEDYDRATFTVRDTNAIYKAGNKIYTNVIIVDEKKYFEDTSYPMQTTYYLVKNIGLIALITEVDHYELLSIK